MTDWRKVTFVSQPVSHNRIIRSPDGARSYRYSVGDPINVQEFPTLEQIVEKVARWNELNNQVEQLREAIPPEIRNYIK